MNGVTFGDKHSYKDWGLILKSRPVISPPSPKTIYIDVPCADGALDLTESMMSDVKYENRNIKCEFTVIDSRNRWSTIYSEILDYLHGQKMKIIFDDDPKFYYFGRISVNEWKSDKRTSTIVIEAVVDPYKMEIYSSTEDWIWDSFNFETDMIHEWKDLVVDGTLSLHFTAYRKTVVPVFTIASEDGSGIRVRLSGASGWINKILPDGVITDTDYKVKQGDNYLVFTGQGTVTVDYRGGRL